MTPAAGRTTGGGGGVPIRPDAEAGGGERPPLAGGLGPGGPEVRGGFPERLRDGVAELDGDAVQVGAEAAVPAAAGAERVAAAFQSPVWTATRRPRALGRSRLPGGTCLPARPGLGS